MLLNNENRNDFRYVLVIGYGDDYWDLGEDEFGFDSLEEMFDEIYTDLTFEEFAARMEKEGFCEDSDQMWYAIGGDNY